MEKFEIERKVALSNFIVSLVKESEALVLSTVPTELNDGGVMLVYVDPLHDKMIYATLRQLFDGAYNNDEACKLLLTNYCLIVMMVRGCTIADNQCVNDIACAVKAAFVRVKSKTDKAGEELGIKEETEEEALAKLKEAEEMADMGK